MRGQGTSAAGERGVSELTGLVLLLGIVVAGAALLFVSGSAVTRSVQDTNEVRSAEIAMSHVDSELGSLSMADSGTGRELDLGSISANDASINRTGEITVSVNGSSACAATVPLTALEYHHESGTTIVYESGAVWRAEENGGVSQLSAPGVSYQQQTLQLDLVDLSGDVSDSTIQVEKNATRSAAMSAAVRNQLFSGSCGDPDQFSNLTLTVTSVYHPAWQRHLESEFGESHVSRTGPETVQVVVPRSMLPPEYDNRRNAVVDFTDGRLLTGRIQREGTLGLGAAGVAGGDDDVFAIDKGEGNTYDSSLTLLGSANANATSVEVEENAPGDPLVGWNNSTVTLTGDGTVQVTDETPIYEQQTRWNNWTEEVPTNETLEIVFVMDESGSMGQGTKMSEAREAAHEFIDVVEATTNGTEPRYSVVGYTANDPCVYDYNTVYRGRVRYVCHIAGAADVVEHHPLNTDEAGAHAAIDGLEPQGNTPISQSIEEAANILQTEGNSSNEQFIVLLTDGFHNVESGSTSVRWPDQAAEEEVPDGVTLHTVGLGDPSRRDDVVLNATANATTGGEYYPVSDADDLGETFADIAENVSTRTVYHNESDTETVLVGVETSTRTVTVSGSGAFDVNLSASRTLTEAEAEDLSVGDTVWVNGTDSTTIDESGTVTRELEVQRFDESANSTYTTTVTRTVDLAYHDTVGGPVNDTVTVTDENLDTDTSYRRYLLHPRATLTVDTGGATDTLWDGRNLNNMSASGVDPGSFDTETFTLADGAETSLEPTFRRCIGNETTGDVVTIGGTDYRETYCTAAGSTLLTDGQTQVHIYPNGSQILADASLPWQESVTEMLDTPDGQYYREDPSGTLYADLPCDNQALVVVEATDNGTSTDANNMVFLASAGRCAENVDMSYLVGVDVSVVSTENDTRVVAAPALGDGDAAAPSSVDAVEPGATAVHALRDPAARTDNR